MAEYPMFDLRGTKKCAWCNLEKPLEAFTMDHDDLVDGIVKLCGDECIDHYEEDYGTTLVHTPVIEIEAGPFLMSPRYCISYHPERSQL